MATEEDEAKQCSVEITGMCSLTGHIQSGLGGRWVSVGVGWVWWRMGVVEDGSRWTRHEAALPSEDHPETSLSLARGEVAAASGTQTDSRVHG